jgi:hypothetical protein
MATNEKIATNVGPAKIDIAYERIGNPDSPPVLLIMGVGAQPKRILIKGMGHNIPQGLWAEIAQHIADIVLIGEMRVHR